MFWNSLFLLVFIFSMQLPLAVASERVDGLRVFLTNGNPEQAIRLSQSMLAKETVSETERFELLSLIADAQEVRTQAQHYDDVSLAVSALQTLKKEFPDRVDMPEVLWRLAWMHWKHGDEKLALHAASELRTDYAGDKEAVQAAMLMARVYIHQKKWSDARSSLIQYGLHAELGSREESLAKAWLAVVDAAEQRYKPSLIELDSVFKSYPEEIEKDDLLWVTYVQMLHIGKRDKESLQQAETFLSTYLAGIYVPIVRLLRADLWLAYKVKSRERIEREYDVLAEEEAEQRIGKQAFMRKLMLAHLDSQDYHTLKPVIIALKRLADQNQLSIVEDEALIDLARLWQRLSRFDAEHSPKQANMVALDNYVRVSQSELSHYHRDALHEGTDFFEYQLKYFLAEKKWPELVAVWERFPIFRRHDVSVAHLQLGVAHGLRMLMSYEQAEVLLEKLYARAEGSVWGQKVMLERARLWLDRDDSNGVKRVLTWLDEHEFTLYRPEMLLLVARMQLQAGKQIAASQSIIGISVDDVALEDRLVYWQVRAEIAEQSKHWHMAARAWREYGKLAGADVRRALIEQANNVFKAKDYEKAEALYASVHEEDRDAAWLYHYSISQLKNGKYKQALEKLQKQSKDTAAGIYADLASLAIADKKAAELLKEYP